MTVSPKFRPSKEFSVDLLRQKFMKQDIPDVEIQSLFYQWIRDFASLNPRTKSFERYIYKKMFNRIFPQHKIPISIKEKLSFSYFEKKNRLVVKVYWNSISSFDSTY